MTTHPRVPEPKETLRKRVQGYRERARQEGFARVEFWLEPEVEQAFQELMTRRKMGRKALLVALIHEAVQKEDSDAKQG